MTNKHKTKYSPSGGRSMTLMTTLKLVAVVEVERFKLDHSSGIDSLPYNRVHLDNNQLFSQRRKSRDIITSIRIYNNNSQPHQELCHGCSRKFSADIIGLRLRIGQHAFLKRQIHKKPWDGRTRTTLICRRGQNPSAQRSSDVGVQTEYTPTRPENSRSRVKGLTCRVIVI